jgi:hypothetical protein
MEPATGLYMTGGDSDDAIFNTVRAPLHPIHYDDYIHRVAPVVVGANVYDSWAVVIQTFAG